MRLEGQSKLGYYPTPELTLQMIPSWLSSDGDGLRRLLDPCCGKGEALAHIASIHPAHTFGIELSDSRAEEAKARLDKVYNCAYENTVTSQGSFSLILLNPPYDGEGFTGGGRRMEETFLVDMQTTTRLVNGGILVYLIPYYAITGKVARHLAGWYEDLVCYRLPAAEHKIFKQVIIFGRKKDRYTTPTKETMETVLAWQKSASLDHYDKKEVAVERATKDGIKKVIQVEPVPVFAPLPNFMPGNGAYRIPVVDENQPFKFLYNAVSQKARLHEGLAAIERLDNARAWLDNIPSLEPPTYEPAITPKQGHIALQVSGGMLGTNVITEPNGNLVAIKGWTRKILVRSISQDEEEDSAGFTKITEDERFENTLTLLYQNGELIFTSDPAQIGLSLDKYVNQLKDKILERNQPAYDFDPEPWEWRVFDPLSTKRRLPGRQETGLTDFQKHLAVSLGRLMFRRRGGFITAEMGSGKTTTGIAIAEYLETKLRNDGSKKSAYPVLVMGPGIVTGAENWPKEVSEVIPAAQAQVITMGAKPVVKPMKIGDYLEWLGMQLDADAFVGKNARSCMHAIILQAGQQSIQLPADALSYSLKQAQNDPPEHGTKAKHPNLLDGRIGGYPWLGLNIPRDAYSQKQMESRYSVQDFLRERNAGVLPHKSFAVMSFETAKLGAGRIPAFRCTYRKRIQLEIDPYTRRETQRPVIEKFAACPHCAAIVSESYDHNGTPLTPMRPSDMEQYVGLKRRYCQAPLPRWSKDPETGMENWQQNDKDGKPFICGQPLFEESGLHREAAASYIKKKAKAAFGFFITDEVHEAKGKGTGVGWAYGTLVNACRWSLGMTGTLFGGYSTSIFMLWYRMIGQVRKEHEFEHGDRDWAKRYGLIRKVYYLEDGKPNEDGTYTGTRFKETVSERPGISPAILRFGLPYCTFSSLNDIGLPLPDYNEEVVRIPLSSAMQDQYDLADGSTNKSGLFAWALDMIKQPNGQGAISVWLNTALNRPDAMFRGEEVTFNQRISGQGKYAVRRKIEVTQFDAISGVAPKEEWLIDQCREEKRHGRKTLVYVRQTGERDIQQRLKEFLEDNGLRVGVLKPTLQPARRASWILKNAAHMDVLLTNAKLVKVGLNLTTFNTGIFYEMDWSLYVVWQAMRRLYRPGAPKPVMMYFPVYENTMEEHLQSLVGQKMASAQMFYGDEVAGALTEDDSGDLLNDLVRMALGQLKVGRADKMFSLGTEGASTNAAYGSLVLPSLPIEGAWGQEAILAWALQHGISLENTKRRKSKVPSGQQSLF
jgi:SAM-dependent methyltransferase